MSHSWLPSGIEPRFWLMILDRTLRSMSSSFLNSARRRSISLRRTWLRSRVKATPGTDSREFRMTCDRCVIFSCVSFMLFPPSEDQLALSRQLVLDHPEHVVILDPPPGHFVRMRSEYFTNFLVEAVLHHQILDERARDGVDRRVHVPHANQALLGKAFDDFRGDVLDEG